MRGRRRNLGWTVAVPLALTALIVSGCSSSSASSGSDSSGSSGSASKAPITILQVVDTTGPTKVYGTVEAAGLKATVSYWNSHGGILGRQLTYTVLNDNGDPAIAASVLDSYLASHPAPNMIIAGATGTDSAAMLPIVKRDHLLDIDSVDGSAACASNAQTTCPTAFVTAAAINLKSQGLANWFKDKGFKKVGILQEEDSFSEEETGPLQTALTAVGISSTVASFPATSLNVTPEISELQSAGVDAVYAEALGAAAGYEGTGRAQLGLVSKLPFVFDAGAASENLTQIIPAADLHNAYEQIARSVDPYVSMPGRNALVAAGGAAVTAQPLLLAGQVWQEVLELHDAAIQANSLDVNALVSALENLEPKYQNDPLSTTSGVKYTNDVHENVSPNEVGVYEAVPVGPLVNGLLQYKQ